MKKLMFLFLCFFATELFAQSEFLKRSLGYRDTYWGEPFEQVFAEKNHLYLNSSLNDFEKKFLIENDLMMSESSKVYYYFRDNKLASIAYEISYSEETEERLLSKFNQKKEIYNTKILVKDKPESDKEKSIKEELSSFLNGEYWSWLFAEDLYFFEHHGDSLIERFINNKSEQKESSARIYKIYINDMTDCYVLSNVVENKIDVVYTERYEEKF